MHTFVESFSDQLSPQIRELPQPNQQSKTTQNNFGWGGTIISKKTHIASATWHHSLRNMAS
jgi:hypothetical protein